PTMRGINDQPRARVCQRKSSLSCKLASVERNAGFALGGADSQRSLDARDVGRRGQLAGEELLEALQVPAHDFEDEIYLAVEHVALTDLGQRSDVLFEGAQVFFRLALEADHRENGYSEAEARRVQIGMVTTDHAGFFQRADPAQARRRGKADAAGQIDVSHPPLRLQFRQQPAVDAVERNHPAPPP